MRDFLRRRLVEPVLALLRQGLSPDKLALSLACGVGCGLFPVLGATTILCTIVALALRLNLPAIQLVNYLLSPLQVLLIIPFTRVGEKLVGAVPQPLSIKAALALIDSGIIRAVTVLGDAIFHASIAWIVIGPAAIWLLYQGLRPMLRRVAKQQEAR